MKYLIFISLIPFLFTNAQTDSLFTSDFNEFIKISADYYTSPLKFDSEDWVKLSAVVGITGLTTLVDKDIRKFSQKNQSNFSDNVFSIEKYFYIEFIGASVISFYGYGLIADNSRIRKLAVKLTEATFLASSISLITKTVIGRGRPYKQDSQYYTNPFTFNNDYNSFPSGHTTLAFAYSTVMANEVDNVFWKIGWYTAAGLVGYARIYHNQHWFSDTLMGAALGYFSGEFVNILDSTNEEKTKITLFPILGGLALQLRF